MLDMLTEAPADRRYRRLTTAFNRIAHIAGDVVAITDDDQDVLMLQYLAEFEARRDATRELRMVRVLRSTEPIPVGLVAMVLLGKDRSLADALRAQLAPGAVVVERQGNGYHDVK